MALYLFTACSSVPAFLMQYYFALCLLAITFIDLEHLVIPMVLVYPTIALGLVSAWAYPMAPPALEFTGPWLWLKLRLGPGGVSLANSLAGLALGWGGLKALSLAYKKVRGREGLGEGDPALLGLIGAFLGWLALPGILLAASIIGLIAAFIFINLRGQAKPAGGWGHMPVPFGFFLAITALHFLRPWNGGG
jgi:leader peptidase (prepilin peptidase)/N-methyltransferase